MRHLHRLAPLWIALISLGISALIALTTPLPEPQLHDEFSYLLAADTFAHGRLTNPTHPLWEFFESFQIIQKPTYMSKYQPGQGLVLALGQAFFGHAIVGVWLSTAAACAALWWAIRAFTSNHWAIIGALVAATHPLMLKWNHSYWGGAVAVMGGALVVGGIVRMIRSRSIGAAGGLGGGLVILAISRPFEGFIFLILSQLLFRAPSPQPSPGGRGSRRHALVVLAGVLVIGGSWIGYYNWRVTGSAMRLPYAVYEATYAVCPPVIWWPRSGRVPEYDNEVMRDYYLHWELPAYERQRTVIGLLHALGEKLWTLARNYLYSVVLLVPVIMSLRVIRRDRLDRRAWLAATVFTLVVFGNLWFFPHYTAPAIAVYLLIVVQGLRHLRCMRGGRWLARGVLALHVVAALVWWAQLDRTRGNWNYIRADLIEQARAENQKLLVIVRPGEGYYAHNEWVYNDADIDASPVVWARDRGADNVRLLEYFPDREAMLLHIDARSMRFTRLAR